MRHHTSRRFAAVLLALYVLSALPFVTSGSAQTLDDAEARFWQQRQNIPGRRELPASVGQNPVSAASVTVDQAKRLDQLRARWASQQTRDLPPPRTTEPSQIFLPGVVQNTSVATVEEPAVPVEVAAYRTATSKVYSLPNGTWQAQIYAQPVHYRDALGQWLAYAPTLQPLTRTDAALPGYRVAGTDLDLRFATPTDAHPLPSGAHLVELRQEQLRLGFTPQHADLTQARTDGPSITYADAFPGADLRYTATGPGVKEELIFRRPPPADAALRFAVQVQGGTLDQRGSAIVVRDAAGRTTWTITPPFMVDRQGTTSHAVEVRLDRAADGSYTLSYTPDAAWLADPARVYPIVLDPTLTATVSGDTYAASSDSATDQHHGENGMLLGNAPTSTERRRLYIQFTLPWLPAGVTAADITNATLRLYQYQDDHGGSYSTRLHRTVDPWIEANVNWPNQPGWEATPSPIGATVSAGRGFKSFNVTTIARAWYANPQPSGEKGLAVVMADETQAGGRFATAQCAPGDSPCHDGTTGEVRPQLTIDYEAVARRNELYLTQSLQFAPSPRSARGTDVTATFSVKNTGSRQIFVPAFRVNLTRLSTGAAYPFPTAAGIRLAPGESYSYSQTQTLTEAGRYKGEAQFFNGTTWYRIYIPSGSTLTNVREHIVQAPKPPRHARTLGTRGKNGRAGEPVNTSTGNFSSTAIDATLPDVGLSLSFGRTFNSLDTATIGSFGPGWAATYDERLLWYEDESVVYVGDDGQQVYFEAGFDEVVSTEPEDPDGDIGTIEYRPNGTYIAEDGFDLTLARDLSTGAWTLTDADFTTTTFDASGRWQTIADRYSATLTASYTGAQLASVRSANHTCAVAWTNGRITTIACPTGTLRYSYSAENDLQSVTDLNGATITYAYDALHRLTRITDGDGRLVVENVYDAEGRVVTQREGITTWTTFNYDTGTRVTTYVDANGRTLTDTYDERDRLLQRVDALGNTERYTYDADDRLLSYTNPLGATWRSTYDERGNLLTEADPLNATWTYTYNERNQRLTATDPLGHTTRYEYAGELLQRRQNALGGQQSYSSTPEGLILAETDELGRTRRRTYTGSGQIATETDPSGATTTYEYDAAGDQTAVIDALGQRTRYQYDAQHRLTRIDHADGSVERLAYDTLGNLISQTNGLGATRQMFYDGNNRLIGETDFTGAVTEYFYDGVGNRVRVVDALGQETTFAYDAIGQLIAQTDRTGATWRYTYDPAGRLLTETDPLGRVITHEYDAAGREIRTVDARGNAVRRSYDALDRPTAETDLLGATTTVSYDALGRLSSRTDPLGRVTRYEYDAVGNLLATIDALGQRATVTYDASNRPVTLTDRTGAVSRSRYDALGRLIARTDQRGATTTTEYDPRDRPIRVTDGLGNRTATTYDAAGRMLRQIDARGFSQTWTYDAEGRERTATDRVGATTTTAYDALGRVARVIDALGGVQTTQYDAEGRVIAETNALGQTRRITYDAVGNPIRVTDARGFVTTTEYDANDNPVRMIDPLGNVSRFVYNAANQPTQEIDARGNVHTTQYDSLGRVVATRDPYGATTTTAYDPLDRVARTTDPRGATTTFAYDAEGRAITTTDALGSVTTTSYDAAGAPLIVTNPKGHRTRTQYDPLGRPVKAIDALGSVTTTSYDAAGNVAAITDPRGATTTFAYDAEGRQTARIDALGHAWRTEYDLLGRAVRTIDPLGNATTTAYDALGNVTRIVRPGGETQKRIYDAANNLIAQADARGFVTTTEYDALNRPIATKDPLGYTTRQQYDAAGNLVATIDGKGQITRMVYDKADRLSSVVDPLGQTVQLRYDPAGSPIEVLDGNGHRTRAEYDLLGRQTARIDALGHRTATSYDATDNPTIEQRPNGTRVTTKYDALDRPVTVRLSTGETETTAYDRGGKIIARTAAAGQQTIAYDLLGRPVRSTDSAGQTVSWQYDAAGRRTATIYPDGRSVATSYNSNGLPTRITDRLGNPIDVAYDADGRLLDLTYPASAQRWAYDSAGRLTAVLNEGNNGAFAAYEYTLDANANRVQERISALTLGGLITLEETAYSYDAADRMIRSQRSGPTSTALDQRITYDAAGNRTLVSATEAGVSWTQQMRYDAADRLLELSDSRTGTTTLSYDAAGQRVSATSGQRQQRYAYDARGRLTTVTLLDTAGTTISTQTATYDALSRRIVQQERAADGTLLGSERTLYDGDEWNVLGHTSADGAQTWLVTQPQGLDHLSVEAGGVARFAHADGLGSYVAYTDSRGAPQGGTPARYGDWGAIESSAANLSSGYGYTGHRQDASGLLYARHRFYDPITATWLTSDPFPADETAPGSLNRYSYVRGNPISRTDPLGLYDTDLDVADGSASSAEAMSMAIEGDVPETEITSAATHAQQQHDSAVAHGTSGARCASRCGTTYTVKRGDTLSRIAARFQVPWKRIARANRQVIGANPHLIRSGQRLKIPCDDSRGSSGGRHAQGSEPVAAISAARWRKANASSYGPGLWGNRTACGQTLTRSTVGVAHKTMRCGTLLKFKGKNGVIVKARVIDRGPYAHGRTFDLTEATVRKMGYASAAAFGVRTVYWNYASSSGSSATAYAAGDGGTGGAEYPGSGGSGTKGYSLPLPRSAARRSAYTKPHHDYPAIDVLVGTGTRIYAVRGGSVTRFSQPGGCGNGYQIDASDGGSYVYCHLSRFSAKNGSIKTGQLLGYSGNTGRSTAPHLHLQIKYGGVKRCPQRLLLAIYDGKKAPSLSRLPTSGCSY
ncbi:MAG TPA: DNRLRE domain-containing protein [Herpetosiphonaceae bacterium]